MDAPCFPTRNGKLFGMNKMMPGVDLPPQVANETQGENATACTAPVQQQPFDNSGGSTNEVDTAQQQSQAGSASPPATVVSFVPMTSGSGASSAASSSSGSTCSASRETELLLQRVNLRLFRQLGASLLALQLLSTMAFCGYAWHIENFAVIDTIVSIFQPWCVITCWKIAVPYYAENSFLLRTSWIIVIASRLSVFLDDGRMFGREQPKTYAVHSLLLGVFVVSLFWGIMELTAKNIRQQQQQDQWQLNAMGLASLESSWKAFLIIVYLLAAAIGGLGGRSIDEIRDANSLLQYDSTIIANEEDLTLAYLNDKMTATQVIDAYLDTLRANSAGSLINMCLVFSFVFVSVAHVSTVDVLQLRVTLAEGIALVAMLLLVIVTLIYLGVISSYHGLDSSTEVATIYISMITLVTILICCGIVGNSIGRDRHPYFRERRRRVDYIQQYRSQEGLPLSGGEDLH